MGEADTRHEEATVAPTAMDALVLPAIATALHTNSRGTSAADLNAIGIRASPPNLYRHS